MQGSSDPSSPDERREAMAEADSRHREALVRRMKRTRLAWIVVVWIVVLVPLLVLLWLASWWMGLLLSVALVWVSWDYYRRGDFAVPDTGSGFF